jgi:hypothetical protein
LPNFFHIQNQLKPGAPSACIGITIEAEWLKA